MSILTDWTPAANPSKSLEKCCMYQTNDPLLNPQLSAMQRQELELLSFVRRLLWTMQGEISSNIRRIVVWRTESVFVTHVTLHEDRPYDRENVAGWKYTCEDEEAFRGKADMRVEICPRPHLAPPPPSSIPLADCIAIYLECTVIENSQT